MKLSLQSIFLLMAAASVISGCVLAPDRGGKREQIEQGRVVFMLRCAECHEAKMPGENFSSESHASVSSMAELSGISKDDELAVSAYMKSVTK